MKVVMLLGHSSGGIGTHVAHLAAALRAQGEHVTVVAPVDTAGRFDLGAVQTWWPAARPPRALRDCIRGVGQLRRLVAASDVLHAHGHQAGLVAALVCLTVHRPPRLVVSWHNAVLAESGRLRITSLARRFVAWRADLVTGASSDLVQEAIGLGARAAALAPVPSPRVPRLLALAPADRDARAHEAARLLVPTGVEHPPGRPLVLTISRVAAQKNLPVLIAAAARLDVACTWVVIGAGDPGLIQILQEEAEAAASPVSLLGARSDVEAWLRAAEVFVLPSQWEARALVVQEAMAAGTPVIAADVGGLHDLVQGCGLLVPVGDATALAAEVQRVLTSAPLREDLVSRGRRAAAALPDARDMVANWLAWCAEPPPMT